MESTLRVLAIADGAADAARLTALLDGCGLGSIPVRNETLEKLVDVVANAEAWDAIVVAHPRQDAALARALELVQSRAPRAALVVCTDELTATTLTLAHRAGAAVCCFAHGAAPLREALERAARRDRGSRASPEAGDLGDAVAASERVRALVYTAATDVIFLVGVDGDRFRFLEINPAFTRATGLTPEQVVGRFVDEVIPEPSASLVLSKYRQAIAERRTLRWEEVTEYPTGVKYGEVAATPVLDVTGRCTTIIGTVHDATDVRAAEETVRLYADIASAVQIGLSLWKVRDTGDSSSITLVASNAAADEVTGIAIAGRRGTRLSDVFTSPDAARVADLVCGVCRDGMFRELPSWELIESGRRLRTLAFKAFPMSNARVGLAIEDVSERERARALRVLESRILEMVASSVTLEESLGELLRAVHDLASPGIPSVLLLSQGGEVRHCFAPNLPQPFVDSLRGASASQWTSPSGAPAAASQAPAVSDIETDVRWVAQREIAGRYGLRACASIPIVASNGRMLGIFALYAARALEPTRSEIELYARVTHVAGIAVERQELDDQLRQLTARLVEAREDERRGIAREIHDELGQSLTAIKLDLAWIVRRAGSMAELGAFREALLERVHGSMALADRLIQQVRRISSELRPGVLDELGLLAAVELAAQEFEKRTGVRCTIQSNLEDARLERRLSTAVYRTFQEALTNVARHAAATHVEVSLESDGAWLRLEVRDDGKGISEQVLQSPTSLGLLGMRERARYVGGRAEVRPGVRGGTVMLVEVPIRLAESETSRSPDEG